MSNIKITELNELAQISDNDYLVIDTGTETFKMKKHAFASFITASEIGIGNVFDLKGSKPTVTDLPGTGNKIGDVWYVEDESVGYIWLTKQGTNQWEQLGLPIDLSNYYTKTETYAKTEVYNKTETYAKSETYNQAEVENLVDTRMIDNYTIILIETTDWAADTLEGESCYSCTKALTDARSGQHSISSCLPTSIATMDDENEAFSLIIKYIQGNGNIKFYAKELPTSDFQVQVVNY